MLLVGGKDALSGIQNITIIMAAPFTVVMVLMCVALTKDLRDDPLVHRGKRCATALEQAVEYGQQNYGDRFFVPVKPHPADQAPASGPGDHARPPENDAAEASPVERSGRAT